MGKRDTLKMDLSHILHLLKIFVRKDVHRITTAQSSSGCFTAFLQGGIMIEICRGASPPPTSLPSGVFVDNGVDIV
jgi:hypothetical protein